MILKCWGKEELRERFSDFLDTMKKEILRYYDEGRFMTIETSPIYLDKCNFELDELSTENMKWTIQATMNDQIIEKIKIDAAYREGQRDMKARCLNCINFDVYNIGPSIHQDIENLRIKDEMGI